MRGLALVALGGCGFSGQPIAGAADGSDGGIVVDGSEIAAVIDGTPPVNCPWTYTPMNFASAAAVCTLGIAALPTVVAGVETTVDFSSQGVPISQTDSSTIRVVRLASLIVNGTLDVEASTPVILLVDGVVSIAGTIHVTAGKNDATRCASLKGSDGHSPGNLTDGSGGGGGAAAAGDGGDGGDGGGMMKGAKGAKAMKKASTLIPMRAGCPGGAGGGIGFSGPSGGDGGGGLQISSAMPITVSGKIIAIGKGGGGPLAHFGAGGGGSGGALALEASAVHISGTLCADGGSGGSGGGNIGIGIGGTDGQCTGQAAMPGTNLNLEGGAGGNGGAKQSQATATDAKDASGMGGGGGGGGGGGWIVIHDIGGTQDTAGATITPDAMFD